MSWDVGAWLLGMAAGRAMGRPYALPEAAQPKAPKRPDVDIRSLAHSGPPLPPDLTHNLMVRSRQRQGIVLPAEGES